MTLKLMTPLLLCVLVAPLLAEGPATVDGVLDALDQRGKDLKDFSADVSVAETDPDSKLTTTRNGKVWFQGGADGQGRIHVLLETRDDNGAVRQQKREYLLSGEWLVDRNYDSKVEVRRQVLKPGEKINLLKLGEGPFPLPIGQDKAEVHKHFDVKLAAPDKDDPAGTVQVVLTPKPETRLARKYTEIDVWMDTTSHMPVRIDTVNSDRSKVRSTTLKNLQVNTGLGDAQFDLPKVEGWQEDEEPYAD